MSVDGSSTRLNGSRREYVSAPSRSSVRATPPPLKLGVVVERVLGHASWADSLHAGMAGIGSVDARWVSTDLYHEGGIVERTPYIPAVLRASGRAWLDVHAGLHGFRPDVLFFNTQKPAYFCQWELTRTPTILMTDVTPLQYDRMAPLYGHAPDGRGPVARAKHWANTLNFRLARAVVPWSNWTASSLVRDYGVASDRIHVIPPGVDTRWWRPAGHLESDGRVRLLFVGGNFERKGGALLLDVFRRLQLHERAELHVVTRDPIQAEAGVVIHRGMQNNSPELLALYQQADAFILPTQADCFSIASIEAMATGLPVVASDLGGIADIVQHGRTGYLLSPGDGRALAESVRHLIDTAGVRAAFGAAGRERAEQCFDAHINARRIVDLARALHVEHQRRRGGRLVPTVRTHSVFDVHCTEAV